MVLNKDLFVDLEGVGVNLHLFDVLDRRHVLFLVLLVLLLSAEYPQLEELQPAFVAKHLGAELNHFTVHQVVRRDVSNELGVPWLYVSDHQKVQVNSVLRLTQSQVVVVYVWFVIKSVPVPIAPRLSLSLLDEIPKVLVETITHESE